MSPAELSERWADLLATSQASFGMERRRLDAGSVADVYACVFWPLGRYGLLVQGAGRVEPLGARMPRCRGVRVLHQERDGPGGGTGTQLWIVLEEERLREIFSVLAADLVNAVVAESSAPESLRRCVDRLCMWQGLFERLSPEGLSEERQRGLFGELAVLDRMILRDAGNLERVAAWMGPDGGHQDFVLGSVAVEVKTTLAKRHARIAIANERQLDERAHDLLILVTVRLEESASHGTSLPALVATLRERLAIEEPAARLFEERLMMAGYLDVHAPVYEARHRPLSVRCYRVEGAFPRLTEANLPAGVGDIRYSIIADDLGAWEMAEAEANLRIGEQP